MNESNYKSPLSKTLFFLAVTTSIGCLFMAAIGEMIMRGSREPIDLAALTTAKLQPNPMSGWAFINPYCAFTPRPGIDSKNSKSVNRYGFISTPPLEAVEKQRGTIRVVFLGGSSTAGTGVHLADKSTWPYKTWELLKRNYPQARIEMINAAVNGFTSFESHGRLWSQIRFFSPDIVIVDHAWNEMYYFDDASPTKLMTRRWDGNGDWKFEPVRIAPRFEPIVTDKLFGWSQLYSALRVSANKKKLIAAGGEVGSEQKEDSALENDFDPRGVEVFAENLRMMQFFCDRQGAEFYVMKQPTLITADLPAELRKERCFTWYHQFNYEAHLRAFNAIYQMIDATFPKNRVIDATELSGDTAMLWDHVHPTEEGTTKLAEIVSGFLRQNSRILNGPR